ncbi:MAG: alpha/beta fold hydrolase [Bacteroidales bacterium]|jgi:pimeloyl-ACP methyl ester carboxylesterase|nr:alpha/beta fold hydrolase [Bacteroidales bacterium]
MKLFFRRFGNGIPVVVLHGLFGLSDNWVTFGRRLGEHYSVYIPDMRNHGLSPHSNFFDFPALESDLLEMIEEWGTSEMYLIGHSLGGKTAMFFTLHHPETVKKLVVVDISLRKPLVSREHQMLLNAMLSVDFSTIHSRSDVDKQLSTWISSEKLRLFLLKNIYWRDRKTLDWRLNLHAINENLTSIFEGIDDPGSYSGPTLFIRGGMSDYILDSDFIEIESKFPGASVKTIADASHWVHADAPREFYTMVKTFLDL